MGLPGLELHQSLSTLPPEKLAGAGPTCQPPHPESSGPAARGLPGRGRGPCPRLAALTFCRARLPAVPWGPRRQSTQAGGGAEGHQTQTGSNEAPASSGGWGHRPGGRPPGRAHLERLHFSLKSQGGGWWERGRVQGEPQVHPHPQLHPPAGTSTLPAQQHAACKHGPSPESWACPRVTDKPGPRGAGLGPDHTARGI